MKNIFINGPISPQFIAESIAKHADKKEIGAHSIFLGQVRKDEINGNKVTAIEYTAYEEMANEQMQTIRELIFKEYSLTCLHTYHSLGKVDTGEICLFVFASSPHRRAATDACNELVEKIKSSLPIWGKEILENLSHEWKINS